MTFKTSKIYKNISKLAILAAVSVLFMLSFTACGKKSSAEEGKGKINVVCTIFPEYDWVRELIKGNEDKFNVTMLMANGADLHNFQPTAEDILKISECDIFIYVGGESDGWAEDALKEGKNSNRVVINLMDAIGDRKREEELVEGMQGEEEEEGEGEEEEEEYDEHVWLSLKNAKLIVNVIEEKLSAADPDGKDKYEKNLKDYTAKLDELDAKYSEMVSGASKKTVVFGDRFPFRYLVDDYNIDYFAAFIGCSAETEASFKTVTFLAEKLDELGLTSILTIETSDQSIAKTIVENTKDKNQKLLTLDSMQAVTAKEADGGKNYLRIMEENFDTLSEALR